MRASDHMMSHNHQKLCRDARQDMHTMSTIRSAQGSIGTRPALDAMWNMTYMNPRSNKKGMLDFVVPPKPCRPVLSIYYISLQWTDFLLVSGLKTNWRELEDSWEWHNNPISPPTSRWSMWTSIDPGLLDRIIVGAGNLVPTCSLDRICRRQRQLDIFFKTLGKVLCFELLDRKRKVNLMTKICNI